MDLAKRKVVLIQGLLAPYRYPIFKKLGKHKNWDFEVWFMGKNVKNRTWRDEDLSKYKFKYRFLKGITLNFGIKDNYPFWINTSVFKELSIFKPDAVIMIGWDSLTSFIAHVYCLIKKVRFILYSESTINEPSLRRFITLPLVKLHVKNSDSFIAGGSRSREYFKLIGANPKKIFTSFNTVDIYNYRRLINSFKPKEKETRSILGVLNKKVIMCYAQIIERKGGDILIQAYNELKSKHEDLALLIIGNGKFANHLNKIISDFKIRDVHIIDDPGDEDVCRYYSIASVFVLPSREEVWGLVVNQAMASGVPVIVSDKVGSSDDLVVDSHNGFVFKSEDVNDLKNKLETILKDNKLQKKMSLNSREIIKKFIPSQTANNMIKAVESNFSEKYTKVKFIKKVKPGFISVVVPVYKDEIGLKNTLESLEKQTFNKFEILVQNDNKGTSSYNTRNKALSKSTGEYIAFIDSGTIASDKWLEVGFKSLAKYDYIGGPIDLIDDLVEAKNSWLSVYLKNREFPVKEFMTDLNFSPTTNLFVKRSLIEEIGGFDKRLISSGDYEFGNRIKRYKKFSQYYNPSLKVFHRSRSFKELIEKQKRLALGFIYLKRYYPDRFGKMNLSPLKLIAPPLWLFWKESWQKLDLSRKIKVFIVSYVVSFIHNIFFIRYYYSRKN